MSGLGFRESQAVSLKTQSTRQRFNEEPPFLGPIWKISLKFIIPMEEPRMIKRSKEKGIKPSINIIMIII